MTTNHYRTLGVTPWAEDSAIRAAYVALMRTYHPDRNPDPEAEARVKEITGAFAVLNNPEKRAAYDAHLAIHRETEEEPHPPPRPPLRNLGLASVTLAVVVSVAFAVWPRTEPVERPQFHRAAVAKPEKRRVAVAATHLPTKPSAIAEPASIPASVSARPDTEPVVAPTPARASLSALPKPPMPVVAKPPLAQAVPAKTPLPMPTPAAPNPTATSAPQLASCGAQCMADRKAQVERIARGFLRQSFEHADARKQELLLSAGNRSAASRAACRSDDCVTEAYLRQIRETTAIVEGQIPAP